jgi:hypothetical protein
MVRRAHVVNHNIIEDSVDDMNVPAYVKIRNSIFECIDTAENGRTSGEIYEFLPHLDPRRVREAIQSLKGMKLIKVQKCRCNSTPIYYSIYKSDL